ncbi:MAG: geranylgeranyl reductase family protein [Caldisphaeraceae archaeon]|nr:geranylgeranyl reductase family protein [Caldisphaeraceae archaeon]MEB3797491.1 geranylgeranyl reductase family protein [Caldisphaeraceae archaeon]
MSKAYNFDVVIVGLGPAGSTLAYFLRKSGLNVAGIDMVGVEGLWGKPCGDAIGKHHFDETGLPYPEGKELNQKVDGIYLISPKRDITLKVEGEGFMINRNEYGKKMVKEAERSGVSIFLNTRVSSVKMEGGKLTGVVSVLPNGEKALFKGKIIVDATGNSALIRRQLPNDWPPNETLDPLDSNIAYREVRDLAYNIEEPNYIRIYIDQEIAPGGYWWFFPEGKNRANIGLGVQDGKGYPSPKSIFKERLEGFDIVRNHEGIASASGSRVPTRRPANTLVWDNFIGIGDNGFTVNPVHGGGMGYAFLSSYHASKVILKAFEAGDFSARSLWELNIAYNNSVGRRQAALDIFRIFLQRLSNDEIEYGLKHGVMKAKDAYETSVKGELNVNMGALQKATLALKMLAKPSLLSKLVLVGDYMKKVQKAYDIYPEKPEGLSTWVGYIRSLYSEYISRIG